MKKEGQLFECFSKKLYGFLVMKGHRYERSYKHNETSRVCWVYIMTPELSRDLLEWKKNRPDSE